MTTEAPAPPPVPTDRCAMQPPDDARWDAQAQRAAVADDVWTARQLAELWRLVMTLEDKVARLEARV